MSEKFIVEIISPDQTILKQETSEVTIPSFEGQMGILKDHIPLITFLRPGIILIKSEKEKKYYVEEGTVEFSNNNLLILTSTVKDLANFEKNLISDLIQKEVSKLSDPKVSDKERYISSYKIETLKEISL
jgi:ATP synthase F1 epsilon subunit|tara:strand:+ start:153 stop:542 length:390 start_codon:yes stop_codon:yes gene_type:complete